MEFKLGNRLKDKVTGFTGIATARIQYINGCIQYCLIPQVDKDGKYVEGIYFDVQRLEHVDDGIADDIQHKPAGGPDMRGPSTR